MTAFDTVSITTTDEGILDLLTKEALETDIDPRYVKVEDGDAILLVMSAKEVKRIRNETVSQTLTIIRKRIEASGLVEPDVRAAGETDIDVQLPGVKKARPLASPSASSTTRPTSSTTSRATSIPSSRRRVGRL